MIDIAKLLVDYRGNVNDGLDGSDATERLLSSTARKYNNLYTELERLKESIGFDKPFPILRLPREIRDEIYTYALHAATSVHVKSVETCTNATENPNRPPAPGLLRVNKQIYQETIGMLYSKNMFRFDYPRELLEFEQQIGSRNRERVRNICILIRTPGDDYDPGKLQHWVLDSVPSHWIVGLKACSLQRIVHLAIEAGMYSRRPFVPSMPRDLQESIEQFLARAADGMVPKLSLKGFQEEEREKFPKRWEVTIKQWGGCIDEQTEEMPRDETADTVDEEQQVS